MRAFKRWIGVEIDPVSFEEKLVSGVGGLIAIVLVVAVSQHCLRLSGAAMVIASMGASAVLLFGVPHGALSQPWPVIAGHTLSAFVGVACAQVVPHPTLAAACAVGGAIALMHQCKCIHPPGGATALTAVIGGPGVSALGYSFVWQPVLVNALTITLVAIAFNNFFAWRRYPAAWNKAPKPLENDEALSHAAVVEALRSLDSFVDVTEDDLVRLVNILSSRSAVKPDAAGRSTNRERAATRDPEEAAL